MCGGGRGAGACSWAGTGVVARFLVRTDGGGLWVDQGSGGSQSPDPTALLTGNLFQCNVGQSAGGAWADALRIQIESAWIFPDLLHAAFL